jgi:hypothetical protein
MSTQANRSPLAATAKQGLIALACVLSVGLAHAAGNGIVDVPTASASSLSHAEAVADLNLWRRAGADRYADDARYGVNVAAYEEAVAQYQSLRQGPAFAQEVARLLQGNATTHAAR